MKKTGVYRTASDALAAANVIRMTSVLREQRRRDTAKTNSFLDIR